MQQALATELLVGQRFLESCSVKQALAGDLEFTRLVIAAADLMTDALHDGKTIFFFGNGGSAADAQHLAAEHRGLPGRQCDLGLLAERRRRDDPGRDQGQAQVHDQARVPPPGPQQRRVA